MSTHVNNMATMAAPPVNTYRPKHRSKFANIPGVTSLPPAGPRPPPPWRPDAAAAAADPAVNVDVIGPAETTASDEGRLAALESRVTVSEKSTRALLVEVVRLQTALTTASKAADDERVARRDAETRARAAQDALAQLGDRLDRDDRRRRADDDAAKTALAAARDAEAAALAARQEAAQRADKHAARQEEFNELLSQLRNQVSSGEQQRQRIEQKLSAMKKLNESHKERLGELESRLGSEQQTADAERDRLRAMTADVEASVERKLTELQERVRRQTDERCLQLEKALKQADNDKVLQEAVQQTNEKVTSFYQRNDAELQALRDLIELNKKKTNKNLHRLHDTTTVLEKQLEEYKKVNDTVLSAEVRCRKQMEEKCETRLAEVDAMRDELQRQINDVKHASAPLRHSIDETHTTIIRQKSDLQEEFVRELDRVRTDQLRSIQEIHVCLTALLPREEFRQHIDSLSIKHNLDTEAVKDRVTAIEAKPDLVPDVAALKSRVEQQGGELAEGRGKIEELAGQHGRTAESVGKLQSDVTKLEEEVAGLVALRSTVDELTKLQNKTTETVEKVQGDVTKIESESIPGVLSRCEEHHQELKEKTDAETEERKREIENLKRRTPPRPQLAPGAPPPPVDITALQQSVKKTGETVQIVKTVLAMKLQSEQKLRNQAVEEINEDIYQLKVAVETLKQFHEGEDGEGEGGEGKNADGPPTDNRWPGSGSQK